jgi:hypothetical protein
MLFSWTPLERVMSTANIQRTHLAWRSTVPVAVIAAILLPLNTASAQLGGLVKKARDKAIESQVEKRVGGTSASSADAAPKFDETTVELTSERVAGMLRGLQAGRAVLDTRTPLNERRDAIYKTREPLWNANQKAYDAYLRQRDENQRCRNDAMEVSREKRQKVTDARNKELSAKAMNDPAFRQKIMELTPKLAEAQQKGDTVELKRLMKQMGVGEEDTKADTVAADAKCGKETPKPAFLVQTDSLDGLANRLTDDIRKIEEKAASTEQKESGLNERQFMMARERIEAYLSAMKYNGKPRGFSPNELAALGARRADFEKVM